MENRESKTHFSRKSRNLDGRKNIDDVWWINRIGERRKEIGRIEQEISQNTNQINQIDKRIGKIDKQIEKRNNNIDTIKTSLKIGSLMAGAALLISVLGAGVSSGIEIWCGLMLVPSVVGISALKVQRDYKKEIERLEEDKCIEEIDRSSYQRTIESLTYKKSILLGEKRENKRNCGHDILNRPQCIYYQHTPSGDENDYSDEVFQVGGTEPYNWTAHKLINRIHSMQEENANAKVKSR